MRECDLTRPSLYRMLAGLEAEGLAIQTDAKQYLPGPGLIALARRALDSQDIRLLARPALERLRDLTGETVHLAVRNGVEMIYIDKIESLQSVRMVSTIGTRVAIHSTGVGKAYLAALSNEAAEHLMDSLTLAPITPQTATKPSALRARVTQARADGFVFDDQENELGIVCYGAAILKDLTQPVACVSVSIPLYRHREDPSHYSNPLIACTAEISRLQGYAAVT